MSTLVGVPACGADGYDVELATLEERAVTTSFDPKTNGLQFVNMFTNTIADFGIDTITSGGLCGGMAYTALDYFMARTTAPKQDYMPGTGTPLRDYLYNRQVHSLTNNADKWAELGFNPGGIRNGEFFHWSIHKDNRVVQLRAAIDAGNPVPIGLKDGGGGGDHQVLAIGYELGAYDAGWGGYPKLKLKVYDPSYPGQTRTFQADANARLWFDNQATHRRWVSFFVDQRYGRSTPPPANPIKTGLVLTFRTGGDDLRGGNDNINVKLTFKDGTTKTFNNVNQGGRWQDNALESVALSLSNPADVTQLQLATTFGGGIGGDNWNMDDITVQQIKNHVASTSRYYNSGRPLFRFTGDQKIQNYKLGTPVSSRRQDYDNDGAADFVVFRPSNGTWYVRATTGGNDKVTQFGVSTDVPVPGDYDGDKKTDVAVWRPSNGGWYSRPAAGGADMTPVAWGASTDLPVPGDYDGDGKSDFAVYRRSTGTGIGTWYVRRRNGGNDLVAQYGAATDIPVAADYDGDGKQDFAVYRPSEGMWYVNRSLDGRGMSTQWGGPADRPVPADYNGDGRADFAVFRPSNGVWYVKVLGSPRGGYVFDRQWGHSADRAIPGDYDGDGKADFTVYRPASGMWFVNPVSGSSPFDEYFGALTDVIPLSR